MVVIPDVLQRINTWFYLSLMLARRSMQSYVRYMSGMIRSDINTQSGCLSLFLINFWDSIIYTSSRLSVINHYKASFHNCATNGHWAVKKILIIYDCDWVHVHKQAGCLCTLIKAYVMIAIKCFIERILRAIVPELKEIVRWYVPNHLRTYVSSLSIPIPYTV